MATRIKSSQIADGAIVAADLHSAIAISTTQSGTFGTLNSNGLLTLTEADILINDGSNNNERSIRLQNTSATAYVGIEGSAANRFVGSSADNMFLGTTTADGIEFATNNNVRATIDSDGDLSLLQDLSVAGLATFTGNVVLDSLNPMIDFSGDDSIIYRIAVDEANNRLTLGHSTNRSLYLSNTGNATFNYDLNVQGNLTVEGTTVTLNTADLNVEDKNITLNYHASSDTSSTADGAGITIQDAVNASTDATILWDATNSTFDFSHGADFAAGINTPGIIVETSGGLDVRMGTDKRVLWQGNIGEIGNVAGFQSVNTTGSANEAFGIRATDIRFATGSAERVRITDTGIAINKAGTDPSQAIDVTGNVRAHSAGYPFLELGVSNSNYFRVVHDNPNDSLVIQKASLTGNIMTFHGTSGTGVDVGDTSNHKDLTVFGDIKNENNLPAIRPTLNFDFVNSKAKDSRISFTRSSTGTHFNGQEERKSAENLTKQSENFADSYWSTKLRLQSVSSNVSGVLAPDNTQTVTSLVEDSSNNSHYIHSPNSIAYLPSDKQWTYSVFAKAGNRSVLGLWTTSVSGGIAYFDITNGTVTTTTGSFVGSARIDNYGGGWYRCSVTTPSNGTGNSSEYPVISMHDGVGNFSYQGNGSWNIYIWGAQLELSSAPTNYIKTTTARRTIYSPKIVSTANNKPRFDYNAVTGECEGLLIEGASTNLFGYGNVPCSANTGNTSLIQNAGVAPDGSHDAQLIFTPKGSAASGYAYRGASNIIGTGGNGRWSISYYIKRVMGTSPISVGIGSGAHGNLHGSVDSNYNVSVNVSGSMSAGAGTATPVGDGWYRIEIRGTTTGSAGYAELQAMSPGVYNEFLLWGFQVENQLTASSYIPTSGGTTATRGSDLAIIGGDEFYDFYRDGEGTWFTDSDSRKMVEANISDNRIDTLNITNQGATANSYLVGLNSVGGTNTMYWYIQSGNELQFGGTTSVPSFGQAGYTGRIKQAFGYAPDNFYATANNATGVSDTSFRPPRGLDRVYLGSRNGGSQFQEGRLKKVAYYNRRLTNAQIKALTED